VPKIDQAPRKTPVKPTLEDLTHARNREDLPVLAALYREMNLRGGDKQNVSADYEALPSDGTIFVNTDGGGVTVTLPALLEADGSVITGRDGKEIRVHRDGFNPVTIADADGVTVATVSTDGRAFLLMANLGAWYQLTV